jgi:hypothetical protein
MGAIVRFDLNAPSALVELLVADTLKKGQSCAPFVILHALGRAGVKEPFVGYIELSRTDEVSARSYRALSLPFLKFLRLTNWRMQKCIPAYGIIMMSLLWCDLLSKAEQKYVAQSSLIFLEK